LPLLLEYKETQRDTKNYKRVKDYKEDPKEKNRNAIKSSIFLLQIELDRRTATTSPGTYHLETKHSKTPLVGADQQRSDSPTVIQSDAKQHRRGAQESLDNYMKTMEGCAE
jgi:hypothetical protein